MRNIFNIALVASVALTLNGCGGPEDPREVIIGKWKVSQPAGIVLLVGTAEFRKNGTVTTEMNGRRIESNYTFLDAETIELVMWVGGRKVTEKNKIVNMTADEFSLRDPQGARADFTRIK
jgi:hypothetical protein